MAVDTWFSLDLPILEAVAEIESADGWADAGSVASRLSTDPDEVAIRLKALDAGGYISVERYRADGQALDVTLLRDARQAIGQWPREDELFDRFVVALNAAAENQSDPVTRSKLKRAADGLGSFGRDITVEVTAALLSKHVG